MIVPGPQEQEQSIISVILMVLSLLYIIDMLDYLPNSYYIDGSGKFLSFLLHVSNAPFYDVFGIQKRSLKVAHVDRPYIELHHQEEMRNSYRNCMIYFPCSSTGVKKCLAF